MPNDSAESANRSGSTLQDAQLNSYTITAAASLKSHLSTLSGFLGSAFAAAYQESILGRMAAAYHGSIPHRAGALFRSALRNSVLYRWLTKEPDQEVIVINLRETLTVGPILVVLDTGVTYLANWGKGATLYKGYRGFASQFVESPVRIVGVVVLAAILVNTLLAAVTGSLGQAGLGIRLLLGALAMLATREDRSFEDLRESRLGRLVVAIFEPPEYAAKE